MLTKPLQVATGELIEAEDLNLLVRYYNEIWSIPESAPFAFNTHNDITGDNLDRRFGWGQSPATIDPTPVASTSANNYNGTKVTLSDINQITAQINAGGYHQEDDTTLAGLIALTAFSVGDKIPSTLYNSVCNHAESLTTNKYKVDGGWLNLSLAEVTSTNTASWTQDLEVVHKFAFTDYNEARYFFNSGGELTFELSMASGGTAGNQIWQDIFNQFDSIRIGAETCYVVTDNDAGETQWDVIGTSSINKGFYTGIIYSATPTFNTILDAGVFSYLDSPTNENAYVYIYSEYNSRRIRIQLKADEVGGTFNVYVKVILIEDVDDTFAITQAITLESGYVQPSTTPLTSDTNKSFMTVGSTMYQFLERNAPTVTEDYATNGLLGWQPIDATDGEQLNWASTDPGTIWQNTGGSKFTKI